MPSHRSLALSLSFKQQLELNLLSAFTEDFPAESVSSYIEKNLRGKTREKVYTTSNTLLTMLLTATRGG
ncbi:hypothetical protein EZS27_034563 [termite gut metagenome]|uniref:Uncharacterized protein n=1 Tax=termite gut metagenome TaxID=433724 RepID=A0A5J4Q2U4_9ZZZZ